MAQIGTFTRDETGAYNGTIKTLTLNVKASIKSCDNDRAPDFRVTATGVEFGAGWSRTARGTGAEYLSLKLDDPSFTAPVYASLVQGDKGEHKLMVTLTSTTALRSKRGALIRSHSPARDNPRVALRPSGPERERCYRHNRRPRRLSFHHAGDGDGRHTAPEFPSRR